MNPEQRMRLLADMTGLFISAATDTYRQATGGRCAIVIAMMNDSNMVTGVSGLDKGMLQTVLEGMLEHIGHVTGAKVPSQTEGNDCEATAPDSFVAYMEGLMKMPSSAEAQSQPEGAGGAEAPNEDKS